MPVQPFRVITRPVRRNSPRFQPYAAYHEELKSPLSFWAAVPSAAQLDNFNVGGAQALNARVGWSTGHNINLDGNLSTDAVPTKAVEPGTSVSNIWATLMDANQESGFIFTAADSTSLHVRLGSPTASPQTIGYECQVGWNGGIDISKANAGTLIHSRPVGTFPNGAVGDAYCFQAIYDTLNVWRKPAAGSWTLLTWVNDISFLAGGYIGLGARSGSTGTIDAFFGGSVPFAVPRLMQYTRRVMGAGA